MSDLVTYTQHQGVATITMDDGKVNVMNTAMIAALAAAFRHAEDDRAVTVLTGRAAVFSAGYDMAIFEGSVEEITATLAAGGDLIHQLLCHPLPVIAASNGHAIAQGAFTLLACDVRIGITGDAKIGLNEVAIGLTIPHYGVELARHQLAPAWFDHATLTGTLYPPDAALRAGFLHELSEPGSLMDVAMERATSLTSLDIAAHAGTKRRVRAGAVEAIRRGIDREFVRVASDGE